MKGKRGEVWFIELDKIRPVVIVSKENLVAEVDHLIATVTTAKTRNEYDVPLHYWEEAGLDRPSLVRCYKLNTVHNAELLFKVGELHEDDFTNVMEKIRDYFN